MRLPVDYQQLSRTTSRPTFARLHPVVSNGARVRACTAAVRRPPSPLTATLRSPTLARAEQQGGGGREFRSVGKLKWKKKKDNTREDEGLVAICRVDVGKVKYLCGRTSTSEPLSWNNDDKTTSIMLRHIKFAWRQNLVNVNILRIQTVLRAAESTADPAWSWKCYLRSY